MRRHAPQGEREGIWRKFGRRASKAGRFGWKHRKKALGVLALLSFAYVTVYFLYVGTVGLVQVIVVIVAVVAAGLARHNENMALRRSLKDQPPPKFSEQAAWARRQGAPPRQPEPAGGGTVYVRSHRRDGGGVSEYVRHRPGAGSSGSPCHCCGAEKAPRSVTIEGRSFPACVRCAAESGWGAA